MTTERKFYIISKNGPVASFVTDTYTFGCIALAFWFNYTFVDGNNFFDVLLFICFFTGVFNHAKKRLKEFSSMAELKAYLDKNPEGE